jgi:hypothetical protein
MKKLLFTILSFSMLALSSHLWGQTDPTNPQIICEGTIRSYQVDYTEGGGAGTPGSTYTWAVTSGGFLGTITPNQGPSGSSNRILIDWATTPPGDYILQVTETNGGCPGIPVTLTVRLLQRVTPTFNPIGPLCRNSSPPALPGTSTNGITGTWSPATINTSSTGTTTYTFTPDGGQCALPATLDITIDDQVTPVFTAIPNVCQGTTAPTLPTISNNGITGTWSPATVSTATPGTTTYTFTPDGGQCAINTTLDVTVDNQITPTFAAVGPLCQNSSAPALPTSSGNGITGTWSPATISTTTPGTTTYTFTPDGGQCATTATLDITINPEITPTFPSFGPYCQNVGLIQLPTASGNGVSGSWSPSEISTSTAGTSTYTFTPNAGQCAVTTSIQVTVDPEVTPTFAAIGPLCRNSSPPALPGTSTNGITGTWSPATINTSSTGTTTYTFTPDGGQCALPATLDITIDDQVTPVFNPINPLCLGDTPPVLSGTSNNGITGSWSPAVISTATAGSTNYTFSPDPGQCAINTDLPVTVYPLPVVAVADPQPVCEGSSVVLTASGAVNYTWTPATGLSSTSGNPVTASPNTTITYTVTGTDANGCINTDDVTIIINPVPVTSPIFHD